MKLCLSCEQTFASESWRCPVCGFAPSLSSGFPSFAQPEGCDGFQPEFFAELAKLEPEHFWFVGRNHLIVWALAKYFAAAKSFLEIGCGTGYVLSGVAQAFPQLRLTGSEYFSEGLPFADARVPNAELLQADARNLPFREEFDVIGAFDVLEHIPEDDTVLRCLHRAVRPGGGILLTVPQHRWLWSSQDDYACHVRRYASSELVNKVATAGFQVEMTTSFVSLLLPVLWLSRSRQVGRTGQHDPMAELRMRGFSNRICAMMMFVERGLIKMGLRMAFGGSLLVVGRKV